MRFPGCVTYVISALVSREQFWIATTIAVISMLLLELKDYLESLSTEIPAAEILTLHQSFCCSPL